MEQQNDDLRNRFKKIWHGIYKGVNVCTEKEKNVSFIQE